jgi:RNA exonuclease 1
MDPTQYLLTVEQTIENDCPMPSYLADVFSKPDGWMETPEIDPDADTKLGNQSVYLAVYVIFCEMARAPSRVFGIVY